VQQPAGLGQFDFLALPVKERHLKIIFQLRTCMVMAGWVRNSSSAAAEKLCCFPET